MLRKTVLAMVVMVVMVAAAQGRSRGAKLGHRTSRQHHWRQRENLYTPAQSSGYQQQPSAPTGAYQNPPASDTQNTGYTTVPSYQSTEPSSTTVIVPGAPPVSSSLCKYPGFFPTPGSCVNFYRCVDFSGAGTFFSVYQFNCPAGTIFDDELDTCNHIGWTVYKRPECADMMPGSLVPTSTPAPEGTEESVAGTTTIAYTEKPAVTTGKPVSTTEKPFIPGGGVYPQPGGGSTAISSTTVSSTSVSTSAPPPPPTFTLECHTDGVYRRHPLYCNRYYQCKWNGEDYVFPVQTCPARLVFAQLDQQCVSEEMFPCEGEMAPAPEPISPEEPTTELAITEEPSNVTTTNASSTATPSTSAPSTAASSTAAPSTSAASTEVSSTTAPTNMVDPTSLYQCPAKGYYPFEGDCIRFYKCVTIESTGQLKGLLYKCPEGFGYSEEKKRCDRSARLPPCEKEPTAAQLRMGPARQLTVDDLAWFFAN